MKTYKRVRSFIGKYFLGGVFCVFVLIGVCYAQTEDVPENVQKEAYRLIKELQIKHPFRSRFQLSDSAAWLSYGAGSSSKQSYNDSIVEDNLTVILRVNGHSIIRDSLIWRLQHHLLYTHHLKSKLKNIDSTHVIDTTMNFNVIEIPSKNILLGSLFFTMKTNNMMYRFEFLNRDTAHPSNQSLAFQFNYSFDNGSWGLGIDTLVSSKYVSIDDSLNSLPQTFCLFQNYPNPFNPITTIRYRLAAECYVSLKVYGILGQEVVELVNGIEQGGEKSVLWNASDVASGTYFYRLSTVKITSEGLSHAEAFTDVKKMIVLH